MPLWRGVFATIVLLLGSASAFAQVADELRRQYSIGYYPPAGQSGERRSIKVRVNGANLVVKARESYVYSQRTNTGKEQTVEPPAKPSPQAKPLDGSH